VPTDGVGVGGRRSSVWDVRRLALGVDSAKPVDRSARFTLILEGSHRTWGVGAPGACRGARQLISLVLAVWTKGRSAVYASVVAQLLTGLRLRPPANPGTSACPRGGGSRCSARRMCALAVEGQTGRHCFVQHWLEGRCSPVCVQVGVAHWVELFE